MWKQDESGRVHTPFEPVVLAATLALIPVLIIEADTKSEGWLTFTEIANWVIWAVFAIELGAVLVSPAWSPRSRSTPRGYPRQRRGNGAARNGRYGRLVKRAHRS